MTSLLDISKIETGTRLREDLIDPSFRWLPRPEGSIFNGFRIPGNSDAIYVNTRPLIGFRTTDELRNRAAAASAERSRRIAAKALPERQNSAALDSSGGS